MTSAKAKSVEASLRLKVIVAVSFALSSLVLLLITILGKSVSTVSDKLLLESLPSALALPDASLNLLLETLIVAGVILLVSGVKVAVYKVPEPTKLVKVPPSTTTSAWIKSNEASVKVKVIVAVWSALSAVASLVITMVGATRSECTCEVAVRPLPKPSV